MKAINRFIEYCDFKGIKPSRFEKDYGLSNGYFSVQLKRNGSLGEDHLNIIIDNCLDLNPEWLLTGKGEMLEKCKCEEENQFLREPESESYQKYPSQKDQEIQYLKNEIQMKDEIIEGLKRENDLLRMIIPESSSKKNLG